MHVLVLNEYFPPDTSATAKLALEFLEPLARLHRVTVLCGRPSYDPTERHPYYLWRREVRGNLVVERVGSTAFPRFQMRRRASNYLTYLGLAIPRALAIRSDVVLSMTDPPVMGIVASHVARLTGRPFVYNIRDLYPDMAVGGNIVRPSKFIQRWERMHRKTLRSAARVIVLGEDMRDRILAKGVDLARISIVRDAVPVPDALPSPDNPVARQIRGDFRFVLVHAGNLGFYGAWRTLVRAARLLAPEGVGLVFIGEGAKKAEIEAEAAGSAAVRFLPYFPAREIPNVLASGDLHILTVNRGLEGVVVPSKLYPLLAAGRPVLAVATAQTDAARIVMRAGCGLVADPDNAEAVADAVRRVMRDPGLLSEMSLRAREIAISYDKRQQISAFVKILEEISSE
ncbi:MAG: glycosyltransferase family 4 protein [Candidatus Acidiferrales bacterium]